MQIKVLYKERESINNRIVAGFEGTFDHYAAP